MLTDCGTESRARSRTEFGARPRTEPEIRSRTKFKHGTKLSIVSETRAGTELSRGSRRG